MEVCRIRFLFTVLFVFVVLIGCSPDSTENTSGTGERPETSGPSRTGPPSSGTVANVSGTTVSGTTTPAGAPTAGETARAPEAGTTGAPTGMTSKTTGGGEMADSSRDRSSDQQATDRQPAVAASNTLVPGVEDQTDGPLTRGRMVSYYGHPWSGAMGELGQYEEPREMVAALKEQAAAYTELDPDRPAIPTIELIASVAQPEPGDDGLYLNRTPPEVIEEYAKLAEETGCLLLLDIQIGYSTIADEIEVLRPFLGRPYVHLAIDTEYDMQPGEIPAQQVGASYASEITSAAQTLSTITERNNLPAKVLVIHQFQYGMVLNKENLAPVENVEMVLHADGFGTPKVKYDKYEALVTQEPIQYGGFKLFYDQDTPLLSPEQVLTELEPPPAVVSYQ